MLSSGCGLGRQLTGCQGALLGQGAVLSLPRGKLWPSVTRVHSNQILKLLYPKRVHKRLIYKTQWQFTDLHNKKLSNKEQILYLLANAFCPYRQARCKAIMRIRRLFGENGVKTKETVFN